MCTSSQKLFCSSCRSAQSKGLLTFSRNSKSAFVIDGFKNFKKAIERCREHEKSAMNSEVVMKLAAIKNKSCGIGAQLSSQLLTDQRYHQEMLMKLLGSIKYLARQRLPLRGHREDSKFFQGNLYQLLLLQASDCPEMKTWLQKREYISSEIVNEIITIMEQQLLRKLLSDIRCSLGYSILADEASDVSHYEQLSLSIRCVD